jgi:aerobic-type carbon monoxide dehydrogenase small subunit (CoxS/CutS family)
MPSYQLNINKKTVTVDVPADMPLLWILRDVLTLTGSKYGCGVGTCGSCTVHVDDTAQRSCLLTAASSVGKKIVTIEGLSEDGTHPVQQAWIDMNVPQCGYCQSGQIMTAVDLLKNSPKPTDEEIDDAMGQIVCRCGTYYRIKQAIKNAAAKM